MTMGRTNPTFRDAIRAIEERWSEFRRALRRRDQTRFDRLFEYVHKHADAAGLLNHELPLVPALFSIDLEQEVRLDQHDDRLDRYEGRLDDLEAIVGVAHDVQDGANTTEDQDGVNAVDDEDNINADDQDSVNADDSDQDDNAGA